MYIYIHRSPGCASVATLVRGDRFSSQGRCIQQRMERTDNGCVLAFTRDSFTSRLLCTNQQSFHSPRLPALPTLVQYDYTILEQYTTSLPTSCVYAIHHTIRNNNIV